MENPRKSKPTAAISDIRLATRTDRKNDISDA
jgi:hypothetical protein